MKRKRTFVIAALVVAVFAVSVPQAVMAAGTTANTSVDNTVVVDWNAGAVAYSTSDTASFVVDRLVTLTVLNVTAGGDTVAVLPGIAGAPPTTHVMAYTVTNGSNTVLDFALSAVNTPPFVTSNISFYWDSNRSGGFDAADPIVSGLDNVPMDSTWMVFVVGDIASTAVTPQVQTVNLRAQALTAVGGTVITASGGSWQASTLQSVLADVTGTAAGDGDYDGYHSDQGYYQVVSPSLTVTKTISSVNDARPFNTPDPKAIPGATVWYRIVVENQGGADATSVSLTDTLSPSLEVLSDVSAPAVSVGSTSVTDNASPTPDEILWTIGTVAPATSANMTYNVVLP